jgi:hypothetical protein
MSDENLQPGRVPDPSPATFNESEEQDVVNEILPARKASKLGRKLSAASTRSTATFRTAWSSVGTFRTASDGQGFFGFGSSQLRFVISSRYS